MFKDRELTYLPPVPGRNFWHHGWPGLVFRNEQQTGVLSQGSLAWGSQTTTRAPGHCSGDGQRGKIFMMTILKKKKKKYNFNAKIYFTAQMASHLNGCSWQDDSEVGGQLFNGFGKFCFPVLDDMTLVKDTVVKFYISKKVGEKKKLHLKDWASTFKTQTDIIVTMILT